MTSRHEEAYGHLCRLLHPLPTGDACPLGPDDDLWKVVFAVSDVTLTLPQLYQALRDKGWLGSVPSEMVEALQAVHDATIELGRALTEQMVELGQAFNAAGIVPVWLKGAALLTEPEWPAAARLMSDLDVWVPDPARQVEAFATLERLGYLVTPFGGSVDWSDSHHFAPLMHPHRATRVELHRHLVRKVYSDLLPDATALGRVETAGWQGTSVARLSLRDRMVQSLVQCSVMSSPHIASGQIRLVKVMDLLGLLRRTGRLELPPDVVAVAGAGPWRGTMSRFLTLLDRDFGVPNPLDHDEAYCGAVDRYLRRGRPSWSWLLAEAVRPPADRRLSVHQARTWRTRATNRWVAIMRQCHSAWRVR